MITITEHQKIELESLNEIDLTTLRKRVNYNTSKFISSSVNLIRYEFDPNPDSFRDGFFSYFRIGAEWIDQEQTYPLIVVPKLKNIDFIEMFMTCLQDNEVSDNFSAIYDIDFEAKPIKSRTLNSILSPLLVIQFLMSVKLIVTKGLRKGYITCTEVLPKVRGRVNLRQTERRAMYGHREQIHCTYNEYSIDIPENRLLKRVLFISRDMISLMSEHKSYTTLSAMCNHCLSIFENVSNDYSDKMPIIKSNKLYHEYSEAIRIAKTILHHQDILTNKNSNDSHNMVPVFRIDMALLFEHYALAQLRKAFGKKSVLYQAKGFRGRYIADFLIKQDNMKIIADSKYVDFKDNTVAKPEYIKQLSAYSRDMTILSLLDYNVTDEDSIPVVPCLIVYPAMTDKRISKDEIFIKPVKQTAKFYTYPINIPVINEK